MAKGPGRRHSQTTHAAKLHWNAAKRSRVVDTRIVAPCRRKRLPRFCGPNYSKIAQPIRWLGPGFPVLSAKQDRQLTTTHIWPIFLTRPSMLLRPLTMPTPVCRSQQALSPLSRPTWGTGPVDMGSLSSHQGVCHHCEKDRWVSSQPGLLLLLLLLQNEEVE